MNTRIIINGKEVTNPYLKFLLIFGAIIVVSLVAALVIFVLFPIIGVAVTLSVGFVLILIAAIVVSLATLALVAIISAWLFGAAELRIERVHKRNDV